MWWFSCLRVAFGSVLPLLGGEIPPSSCSYLCQAYMPQRHGCEQGGRRLNVCRRPQTPGRRSPSVLLQLLQQLMSESVHSPLLLLLLSSYKALIFLPFLQAPSSTLLSNMLSTGNGGGIVRECFLYVYKTS